MNWQDLFRIIIIVIIVLVSLAIIIVVLFPLLKNFYEFKNFKKIYYRKVNRIAYDNDYLLINNLSLRDTNGVICEIDHILFANKYIYVIRDRFYRGGLSGKYDDNIWFFYGKKGERRELQNPMKNNEARIDKLVGCTQCFDRNYFISVVLINDNAVVKNLKELNRIDSFICPKHKLKKLIKAIESRDIAPIDQKALEKAVLEIAELKNKAVNEDEE